MFLARNTISFQVLADSEAIDDLYSSVNSGRGGKVLKEYRSTILKQYRKKDGNILLLIDS